MKLIISCDLASRVEPTFANVKYSKKRLLWARSKQTGQVLIVILAFSAILGAGLLSIYNTAQLSNEKRELVNAADAAAYSGASILAQGLNYTAYTNRAILANNALIGQMTAMRSTLAMSQWYWTNTETAMRMIAGLTRWIPYLGAAISGVAQGVARFSDFWGEKIVYPIKILAEVLQTSGTAAVGLTNHALWLSQQAHLADSVAGFEPNMIKIAKDNAPDADVDWALHATAFGPLATLGSMYSKFEVKVRGNKRTVGNKQEALADKYLNYVTETNRNVATPAYLGGRNMLPNAVGLWIATGCDSPGVEGMATGALTPLAEFGQPLDTAIQALDTLATALSFIANPIMCLYERHGGSELVQQDDGKFAWTSIDAMAFKVPLINTRLAFAGGAYTTFTTPNEFRQRTPDSLKEFINRVKRRDGGNNAMAQTAGGNPAVKYFGHQVALPADCVEILTPGAWNHYVVGSNLNVDKNNIARSLLNSITDSTVWDRCVTLATGTKDHYENKGLFGNELRRTADKIVGSSLANEEIISGVLNDLANTAGVPAQTVEQIQAQLRAPTAQAPTGPTTSMPPGISGDAGPSTTTGPNTQSHIQAGQDFLNWSNASGMLQNSVNNLRAQINPTRFYVDPAGVVMQAMAGTPSAAGRDGGPGFWTRLGLRIGLGALIDVDALIDMMRLKVSDGVERPRNATLNRAFHILADGLPPWFWDVRPADVVQNADAANFGEERDLIYLKESPQDYHERRYNLGPIVYLPLIKSNDKLRTAENTGRGGAILGLPDYEESRNGLRAIGKARVFFRQPSDQWLNRYKVVVTASLILPYWQVRNESLSYVDKTGLLLLDGIVFND
jgi:hypothetical protein